MSDLISKKELYHKLGEVYNKGFLPWGANEIIKDIIGECDSVENKGEWIKIQSGDKDFPESIVCSKCKNENSHLDFNEHGEPIGKVFVTSKFCPNCGADMRGDP